MVSNFNYPNILIITEEPLKANSAGFGRTMVNIFRDYPRENVLFYVQDANYEHEQYKAYNSKFITFNNKEIRIKKPRFYANPINFIFNIINLSWQTIRPLKKHLQPIISFKPDCIIVVPMLESTLVEGYRITNILKIPFYVYLMDDWMQSNFIYAGGLFQITVKKILQNASGWLMISKYLKIELENRYNILSKPSLILHNPVKTNNLYCYKHIETSEYTIGYAGSIWGFHYDGLEKVAEAIYVLRSKGIKIKLVLYTQLFFWQKDEATYLKYEVAYGGLVKYDALFNTLNKCHLLLCTTSFKPKYKHIVATSVFTKITDYMASGRPVWCYGPDYAANNRFLIEKKLEYANSFTELSLMENFILQAIKDDTKNSAIVNKQNELLKNEFDSRIVMENLKKFVVTNNLNAN